MSRNPRSPAELHIRLLGAPEVTFRDQPLGPFPTRRCTQLLAYLVVNRQQAHERTRLAGILWPDQPEARARRSLNTALWRLRQTLGPAAGAIVADATTVRFVPPFPCWIDAEEIGRLNEHTPVGRLARAVEHYRGDFLAGFYDDWVLLEQERLRECYLRGLERLMTYHRVRGEFEEAITCARRILAYDPLREEMHRELMRLYQAAGKRSAALAQYRFCCQALKVELGLQPMPETTALYERIRAGPPPWDWESCRAAAQAQVERQLAEMRREKYRAELYTPREAVESEMAAFVAGEANGLVLVGRSGVGKTNLLCHLAERWLAEGHLVLFYHAGGALTLDVARDVARDLCGVPDAPLLELLAGLGRAASQRDRAVVLIFDGINEFRHLDAGPPDLLKRLDGLIGHEVKTEVKAEAKVKVILSCRTIAWNQMDVLGQTDLFWNRYHRCRPLTLEPFTPEELRRAYPAYRRHFQLRTPFDGLSGRTRRRCQDPLLLRLTAGVHQGRALPAGAPTVAVFRDYYARQVRRESDRRFLDALVTRLAEARADGLSLATLASDPQLAPALGDEADTPYQRLRDAGVLLEVGQYARQVRFTYNRLFKYLLARHYLARRERGELPPDFLVEMARQAWDYPPLWGAALTILLLTRQPEDFTRLAASDAYEPHELAVEGLAALYGEAPKLALDIARRILDLEPLDAKRVALKAASEIGLEGYTIFRVGADARSERTRRATMVFIYLLWQRDTAAALAVLSRLVEEISLGTLVTSPRRVQTTTRLLSWFSHYDLPPGCLHALTELIHTLAVRKLRLPRPETAGATANLVRRLLARNTTSWPGDPGVLNEVYRAASLTGEERAAFRRVVANLRLGAEGIDRASLPDLRTLYRAGADAARIAAQHQLAMWLHLRPEPALAAVQTLFDEADSLVRLWLLLTFLPLSASTPAPFPASALTVLEHLTARLAHDDPPAFQRGLRSGLMAAAGPMSFLPLGLRYGQAGRFDFPLLASLITDARDQPETVAPYLRLLAPVGWTYPQPVLDLIAAATDLEAPVPALTLKALGVVRALHPDGVEGFLVRVGASESLKRRVRLAVDVEQIVQQASLVAASDLRISSLIIGAPYGRWVTDAVLDGYLECASRQEAGRRFSEGLFDVMVEAGWRLNRLLGLPD